MSNTVNVQTEFLIGKMGIMASLPDKGIGIFDTIMTDMSGLASPVFSQGVFPIGLEFTGSGSQPVYGFGAFEAIQ